MFFKNALVYKVTEDLNFSANMHKLAERAFNPCGPHDAVKVGFSAPYPGADGFAMDAGDGINLFSLKRQVKLLPPAVINEQLQPLIDKHQAEKGRPLSRKEKLVLKEDLIQSLLPHALPKSVVTHAVYDEKTGHIIINTTSHAVAEELLALLRISFGSLPALPWCDANKLSSALQNWFCLASIPPEFQLGHSAELVAPDEDGARAKFTNQLLTADDVQGHTEDKLVKKLELSAKCVSFVLSDSGAISKIHFADSIIEENSEIGWDDVEMRISADLLLCINSIRNIISIVGKAAQS